MPRLTLAGARVNAGYTQEEAAKKLEISSKSISNYENGKVIPKLAMLQALANLYGCDSEDFFIPCKFD